MSVEGTKMVCIDNNIEWPVCKLTIGKQYYIIHHEKWSDDDEFWESYWIRDDGDNEVELSPFRFISIEQARDLKINQILP